MTLRLHSFKCYHKTFDIVAEQDSKLTLLPAPHSKENSSNRGKRKNIILVGNDRFCIDSLLFIQETKIPIIWTRLLYVASSMPFFRVIPDITHWSVSYQKQWRLRKWCVVHRTQTHSHMSQAQTSGLVIVKMLIQCPIFMF